MPANIELSGVETSLVGIMSSETVLKEYIELIGNRYDYIIVDCSPNLGQLTLNAGLSSKVCKFFFTPLSAA